MTKDVFMHEIGPEDDLGLAQAARSQPARKSGRRLFALKYLREKVELGLSSTTSFGSGSPAAKIG